MTNRGAALMQTIHTSLSHQNITKYKKWIFAKYKALLVEKNNADIRR